MQCHESVYSIRNSSSAEEDSACGLRGSLHYEECHLCSTRRECVQYQESRICSTIRRLCNVRRECTVPELQHLM